MKIAVANDRDVVSQHFGHCESFVVFETKGNEIVNTKNHPNPGHRPGYLPVFLKELGVNIIIAGGMGGGAITLFEENNIKVITGASGKTKDVVQKFLEGELKSSNSVCKEHSQEDECK